ncbi:hypothetical protein D3C77_328800 [compost metagenome]
MHLILNPLQKIKLLAVARQMHRLWRISYHQLRGLMLVILNETANGNVQAQFIFQHVHGGGNLSLPAVHDDKIRLRQVFFKHPLISAANDFAHRFIIIGSFDGAYFVFPVLFFRWLSIHKYDHGRYGIRPLNV